MRRILRDEEAAGLCLCAVRDCAGGTGKEKSDLVCRMVCGRDGDIVWEEERLPEPI